MIDTKAVRERLANTPEGHNCETECAWSGAELLEATYEIDRLRAALREIAESEHAGECFIGMGCGCHVSAAKKALEE